ncbi:MAG: DUF2442 domain-containing protein, partial [Tannerella sp.]|nr:DUF2442 domain-containing protein [Tannerella sp.]
METITVNEIKRVWLTDDAVHIQTVDGKEAKELFADFPRLRYATAEQRNEYSMEHFGIRWEALDEDLSYEGFLQTKMPENSLSAVFKNLYGINISAIARRTGLPQSLMAAYVSGIKKPSEKRKREIEKA